MFSDVHNQMHFSVKFSHEVSHKNTNDIHGCTHVKWNPNKAEEFSQGLHNDNENILREINHTLSNTTTDSVTHGQVNNLLNELGNVLIRTATSVFGSTTKGKKYTTSNNKPWFNNDCKHKRDEFHKTRNAYRKFKTQDNKILMNKAAKEFRKTLHTNYKKQQEKCANELRPLSKNNTKGFWNTLHKFSNRKKKTHQLILTHFMSTSKI